MKSKKGSHVGVVLSFVLFITFVVYLYAITQSNIDIAQSKEDSLTYLKENFLKSVSATLNVSSVGIEQPSSYDCVNLVNFLSTTNFGNRILASDEFGNSAPVRVSPSQNTLSVDKETNSYLLTLYSSEEFEISDSGSFSGCQNLGEGSGYLIGLTKTEEYLLESKILDLINQYSTDYSGLKSSLGVNPGDNFGITFTYNNGVEVGTQDGNVTTNVYVEQAPIQYITTGALRDSGVLSFRIW